MPTANTCCICVARGVVLNVLVFGFTAFFRYFKYLTKVSEKLILTVFLFRPCNAVNFDFVFFVLDSLIFMQ